MRGRCPGCTHAPPAWPADCRRACSLAKQLDEASPALPSVIQALRDTAPAFSLGLPALTKLLCNSSKRGRHAKALAIFHAAPALQLAPDLPLCNAALMAAGSAGNAAATAAIFDGMVAVGIQPDSVTYRAAVTSLTKQAHIHRALQVRSAPPTMHGPHACACGSSRAVVADAGAAAHAAVGAHV
jgi:hypothetical protein